MPIKRTIMLGVVGDSAAGKTTITRDIARILGEDNVTVICTDDYHRYNRQQRKEMGISALDPACNYMDIMEQHLDLLRRGHPILKPVYNHSTGDFDPPVYVEAKEYIIAEGLLGFHSKAIRRQFDVKVYLAPEEDLRVQWKIKRDTAKRGYTEAQVIESLKKRVHDSANFIRPQQEFADLVVSFIRPKDHPEETGSHLNVQLRLRPTLRHPEISEAIDAGREDCVMTTEVAREAGRLVEVIGIDGRITTDQANHIESIIWRDLPALKSLKPDGFGEYQSGDTKHQSHPLALTQLLIAYHMLLARQELDTEMRERERKWKRPL